MRPLATFGPYAVAEVKDSLPELFLVSMTSAKHFEVMGPFAHMQLCLNFTVAGLGKVELRQILGSLAKISRDSYIGMAFNNPTTPSSLAECVRPINLVIASSR